MKKLKRKYSKTAHSFSLYICPCLLSFFLSLSLYLVSKFKSKTNNLSICAWQYGFCPWNLVLGSLFWRWDQWWPAPFIVSLLLPRWAFTDSLVQKKPDHRLLSRLLAVVAAAAAAAAQNPSSSIASPPAATTTLRFGFVGGYWSAKLSALRAWVSLFPLNLSRAFVGGGCVCAGDWVDPDLLQIVHVLLLCPLTHSTFNFFPLIKLVTKLTTTRIFSTWTPRSGGAPTVCCGAHLSLPPPLVIGQWFSHTHALVWLIWWRKEGVRVNGLPITFSIKVLPLSPPSLP